MNEQVAMTIGKFLGLQVGRTVTLEQFFLDQRGSGLVRLSEEAAAKAWLLFPFAEQPQTWPGVPRNLFTGKTATSPDGKHVLHEVIELRMQQDKPLGTRFGCVSWLMTPPTLEYFDIVLMTKE